MSTDAFIPEGYEAPASGGGFTKLEDGSNAMRILSNPFMTWLSWTDGKASMVAYNPKAKPAKGTGTKDSVKHAWGLIVWNYKTKQIEVLELDKQDVINGLIAYSQNPKWGHPKKYDIVINKTGTGMDTSYTLTVEPHSEVTQDIVDAFIANPVDLSQLLVEGGNPYINNGGAAPATQAPSAAEIAAIDAQNAANTAAAAASAQNIIKTDTGQQAFEAPEGEIHLPESEIPAGFMSDGKGGIKKKMPF